MTLDELVLLRKILYELGAGVSPNHIGLTEAKKLVNREIKLKTLDPRLPEAKNV